MGIDVISVDFGCDDLAGARVLYDWAAGIVKGAPEMNSLVALGTLAAWGYSTCVVFAPTYCPVINIFCISRRWCHHYPDLFGRFMESRAKGQAGAAIERLIGLQPQTAWIKTEDGFSETRLIRCKKAPLCALSRVKKSQLMVR